MQRRNRTSERKKRPLWTLQSEVGQGGMMTLFLSSLEYRAALTHRVSPLPILQTAPQQTKKLLVKVLQDIERSNISCLVCMSIDSEGLEEENHKLNAFRHGGTSPFEGNAHSHANIFKNYNGCRQSRHRNAPGLPLATLTNNMPQKSQ
jgi:hypothetical protein